YGAFYRSALHPLLSRINAYLMGWVRKKYKRSYSAGLSAGGSQAPVVKSLRRASSMLSPHLVAVSR
ncbi:MAG: hypothetical protein LC749_07120, partial [Actinobacteria bacterium]|nr:hypothetical protein [Actinomycetota bacterium]